MSPLQDVRASIHHGVLLSRPRLRPTLISVRAMAPGNWHVTSRDGRFGGMFKSRDAALHYARDEAVAQPRAVVVIFDVTGLATCETYDGHERVRVSAIRPQSRAA